MTIHELDIAWAGSATERRRLRRELSTTEALAAWSHALISANSRLEGDTK